MTPGALRATLLTLGFKIGGGSAPVATDMKSVANFPASGTDDTAQIQAAFAWVASKQGAVLSFEHRKTYVISATCFLSNSSFFTLLGNDATIKAANGMSTESGTQLVHFESATDGNILDLHVDANRSNRVPADSYAHSVLINTNTARLTFRNCTAHHAVIDGFYVQSDTPTVLASLPTDIVFINCSANDCFRNNLSLINSNRFRDFNGVYNNANGTAPQAGIDVEPNATTEQGNIDARFYNTTTNNNVGFGFSAVMPNTQVKCYNMTSSFNGAGAVTSGGAGSVEMYDLTVEGYANPAGGIINVGDQAGRVFIKGLTALNCLTGNEDKPLVYTHAGATGPIDIRDVLIDGISSPVVSGGCRVVVDGVRVTGYAASATGYLFALDATANQSLIRDVDADSCAHAWYISASDVTVTGFTISNATADDVLGVFDSSALRPSVNDYSVYAASGPTANQVMVRFANVPARVTQLTPRSGGAAWPTAQVMVASKGTDGSITS